MSVGRRSPDPARWDDSLKHAGPETGAPGAAHKSPRGFGLRREVKRHAAFARTVRVENSSHLARTKAVSPLRSATALQEAAAPFDNARTDTCHNLTPGLNEAECE